MDMRNKLDIYIPKEAEVKSLPLNNLPNSVLKRMRPPLSDDDTKTADSPDVTWICPAVIRRKDQGTTSAENTKSLLGAGFRSRPNPLQMSFVSSSRLAWEVLKNVSSGTRLSKNLRQDSAPLSNQNAVVIYGGQVYLCIRRSTTRNQNHPKTRKPQPSHLAAASSTSEQEPVRVDSQKVKPSVKKSKEVSTVEVEPPARQPSDSEFITDGWCAEVSRRDPVSEEVALQSACVQPQEEHKNTANSSEYKMHNVGEENAAWNNETEMDSQDADAGMEHTWTQREPLGAAAASSSLHRGFDFQELENEERIAQLKAQFMQDDAALKNLLF